MITRILTLFVCCMSISAMAYHATNVSCAVNHTPYISQNKLNKLTISYNTTIDSADADFIKEAALFYRMQIQTALLVKEKSKNHAFLLHADALISTSQKAEKKLKQMADNRNITLSDPLSEDHQQDITKLYKLNGTAFDKFYLDIIESINHKAMNVFKKVIARSADTEIKTYAESCIIQMEMQFEKARLMKKILK